MSVIRIAMAQINPTVGDIKKNASMIVRAIGDARDAGADIVSVPELSVCGYPPEDLLIKPAFLDDCKNAIERIASQAQGIVAIIGFPYASKKNVYNAAALIEDGNLIDVYHKNLLPNYGVFDEERYFTKGGKGLVVLVRGVRIMPAICEDIWIEGARPEKFAIEAGVDVVVNISASPFHVGKLKERKEVVAGFAKRTGAYVCYNNLVGGQDELVFDGASLAMNPDGELVAMAKRFEEDLLITDIEIEETAGQSSRGPSGREKIPPRTEADMDRLEETYKALVLGTRDYALKNGFNKILIGLSGGVDSSLTACVAVDALGKDNVAGVTMPSQYTSDETRSDAAGLSDNLGIKLITVPIKNVFETYQAELEGPFGLGEPGIEAENLQARIRGNILMALSNRFGWMVLTTGNKSETAVGYCTLYGDMAGGFAVIKDVPKMLVYELSEYVNNEAGRQLIPGSVIERPPTAELAPGQKDEDSLPPYPLLDAILQAYVEQDKSPEDIAARGFDPEIVNEVIRMVDRNEYKRRQSPPGVKITPKAFGKDRRLPITNGYHN